MTGRRHASSARLDDARRSAQPTSGCRAMRSPFDDPDGEVVDENDHTGASVWLADADVAW
jgi:hypothetical protein